MEGFTSIKHLPDECLALIFCCLNSSIDQQSFGLTCRRWLQIQNLNCRSLRFRWNIHLNRLLSRFQHLESLSLPIDITDSGLTFMQSYGSNLRNLDLHRCSNVSDNGLTLAASSCPLLTVISLYECHKITDHGLETLANGCPLLTTISLYCCLKITDYGLETLANGCLSLKYVNLSYCSQISDKGLKALTQKCRQLQVVKISNCDGIAGVGFKGCSETLAYVVADSCKLTPDGIKGIVSGGGLEYLNVSCLSCFPFRDSTAGIGLSSNLKFLNFGMCRSVCDASIITIAKGCPLLEEWNLVSCDDVNLSGWQAIGLNCQNLERLHVNRCRNLCDLGLQSIQSGCKSLSILYMNGCFRLSATAIELFKYYRADVQIKEGEFMCVNPSRKYRLNS
ncbi:hypothetical protein QN277_023138 [Acacia crassicarpa]|uniref:F-box/LRR-repeat protein 15-like leucin rich repeat domain-containing protein n=1 Tax=Acacia crassicarpa TaxID=499986 RepID=A0AAE1MJG2_9FABA|nr:hypothetical protein QN277_023138 [Acacia crassicarpa]